MNTAVINVKVPIAIKKEARMIADEMGLSLSALIHGFLRHVIRTRSVTFSAPKEIPNAYMRKALKQSEKDIKEGWVSPTFTDAESANAWLDDPKRKYVRQIR